MNLSEYKIEDFRKEILRRNTENKKAIIDLIQNKYKDIYLFVDEHDGRKPGYGVGLYEYDFVWLDGIYNKRNFRICFYTQDIDKNSYNIHIFHGFYTFQKNLVKNISGPYSIFNMNMKFNESCEMAISNLRVSSYGIDNFDLEEFMNEFLEFIEYEKGV